MRARAGAGILALTAAAVLLAAAACGGAEPASAAPFELAFSALTEEGAGPALFLADRDGGRATRVSEAGEAVRGIEWSPDGSRLAYAACEDEGGERCTIFTVAAAGGERVRLGEGSAPHWSPDGRRIAFVKSRGGARELYVTDSDRDAPRQKTVTLEDGDGGGVTASAADPWSRDGRFLAVTRLEGGEASEVLLVRGDGQWESRVSGELEEAAFLGWSPDGEKLLLAGRRGGGRPQLFLVGSDGAGLRAVGERFIQGLATVRAAWSADGALIAVASQEGVVVLDAATFEVRWAAGGACEGAGGIEWTSAQAVWFTRGCDGGERALVERDFSEGTEQRTAGVSALEFAVRPD